MDNTSLIGVLSFVALILFGWIQSRRLKKAERINSQLKVDGILNASKEYVVNADIDDLVARNNQRYGPKSGDKKE